MGGLMTFVSDIIKNLRTLHSINRKMSVHAYNGSRTRPPFPITMKRAQFGMGCFWGAEKLFWKLDGVYSTMVGYSGGDPSITPTYEMIVYGQCPRYAEVVKVIYDPQKISYEKLLKAFWEGHVPSQISDNYLQKFTSCVDLSTMQPPNQSAYYVIQGDRQGNDVGEHYRSCVFCYRDDDDVNAPDTLVSPSSTSSPSSASSSQYQLAKMSADVYQSELAESGHRGSITTEVGMATSFHYADSPHQQYLHKNPGGYCGLGGTGVSCNL